MCVWPGSPSVLETRCQRTHGSNCFAAAATKVYMHVYSSLEPRGHTMRDVETGRGRDEKPRLAVETDPELSKLD